MGKKKLKTLYNTLHQLESEQNDIQGKLLDVGKLVWELRKQLDYNQSEMKKVREEISKYCREG